MAIPSKPRTRDVLGEMLGKVVKLEPERIAAASFGRVQPRSRRAREGSPLTLEMKEFVRNVLVPILEKEYLALNFENKLAKETPMRHTLSATRPHRS
jgi:hypothetical protein